MSTVSSQILLLSSGEEPIGVKDNSNTVFMTANKFLQKDGFALIFNKNGQEQLLGYDYIVSESGGSGTGFDTVITRKPPRIFDTLICHYVKDC